LKILPNENIFEISLFFAKKKTDMDMWYILQKKPIVKTTL